jgi:hypothetical protein
MPVIVLSGLGALPVMSFSGGQFLNKGTSVPTIAQPYTVSAVVQRRGSFTSKGFYLGGGSIVGIGFAAATNTIDSFSSTDGTLAGVTDSATHAIQTLANGASSLFYVDGSGTTKSIGAVSFSASIDVGTDGFSEFLNGYLCEVGLWSGDKSGNNLSVNNNQYAYWGF